MSKAICHECKCLTETEEKPATYCKECNSVVAVPMKSFGTQAPQSKPISYQSEPLSESIDYQAPQKHCTHPIEQCGPECVTQLHSTNGPKDDPIGGNVADKIPNSGIQIPSLGSKFTDPLPHTIHSEFIDKAHARAFSREHVFDYAYAIGSKESQAKLEAAEKTISTLTRESGALWMSNQVLMSQKNDLFERIKELEAEVKQAYEYRSLAQDKIESMESEAEAWENSMARVNELHGETIEERDRYKTALNKIGMMTHGPLAYTAEFQDRAREIIDEALQPEGEGK